MKSAFFTVLLFSASISVQAQFWAYYYIRESSLDPADIKKNRVKEVQYQVVEKNKEISRVKFRTEKFDLNGKLICVLFQHNDTIDKKLDYQYDYQGQRIYERAMVYYNEDRDSLEHHYFFENGKVVCDSLEPKIKINYVYDSLNRLIEKCDCGSIPRKKSPSNVFDQIFGSYVRPLRDNFDTREVYKYNEKRLLSGIQGQYFFKEDTAISGRIDYEEKFIYNKSNTINKKLFWKHFSGSQDTIISCYNRKGRLIRKGNNRYQIRYFYGQNGNRKKEVVKIFETDNSAEENYEIEYVYSYW